MKYKGGYFPVAPYDHFGELRDVLLREGLRAAVEKEKLQLVDDPAVEEANFGKDLKFQFIPTQL